MTADEKLSSHFCPCTASCAATCAGSVAGLSHRLLLAAMGCCCSTPRRRSTDLVYSSDRSDPSKKLRNGLQDDIDKGSDGIQLEQVIVQEAKPLYYIVLWDYAAGSKAEVTVQAGDRLQKLNDAGGEAGPQWIFATIMGGDRCGTGYVPRMFVATEGSLEAERWFFGRITRWEAENYLRDAPPGTFLVRSHGEDSVRRKTIRRAAAEYTISLKRENGSLHHYHIWRLAARYGDGYFVTKKRKFPSVTDLVNWYKHEHPDEGIRYFLVEPPRKPVPTRIELSSEAQKNWREIPRSQIMMKKEIGRGHFGVVFEGIWHSKEGKTSQRVAVKVLKHGSSNAKAQFLQEAVTMKNLSHRRLVKLHGVACSKEPYWLITEFVKDGSLRDYLKDRRQRLSDRTLVEICLQAAEGMAYLEEKLVIHRDLAARNVLIDERTVSLDAPLIDVKIADFGLAKLLPEPRTALQTHKKYRDIPVKWTAPEALQDAIYSHASDVWSFGILCHEVFTHGQEPYHIMNGTMVKEYVVVKRLILRKHDKVPARVYDLMTKCFRFSPSERPTFKDVFSFFDSYHKELDSVSNSRASRKSRTSLSSLSQISKTCRKFILTPRRRTRPHTIKPKAGAKVVKAK